MRHWEQALQPPCCTGAEISHKHGRRQLRRTSNGLGLFLFCCGMTSLATAKLLSLFLQGIGYHGSLLYSSYSYLHPSLYYLLVSASFVLSFFVPGLLYMAATRMPLGRTLPSQKIAPSIWIALFLLGSALALMANLPVNWISDWINSFLPQSESALPSSPSIGYAAATPAAVILSLIRTIVLPAFFEEFVFRGIVLGQLRRYGDGIAVVISAILFGIFHGNLRQIPFAFLVGLVLGYIVVRTNNIWITIAIHFFNNAFACFPDIAKTLLPANIYTLTYNSIFYGTFVLGALAALFLLWRWRDFFLPHFPSRRPLPLPSRLFAWISTPGTWLVVAFCVAKTFTPWI